METTTSQKLLDAWCEAQRGRAARIAEACGVTATTVHNWRRGAIRPTAENRIAIEVATSGEVRAVEWEGETTPLDPHAEVA